MAQRMTNDQLERILGIIEDRPIQMRLSRNLEERLVKYIAHLNKTLWPDDPLAEDDRGLAMVMEALVETALAKVEHTEMDRKEEN